MNTALRLILLVVALFILTIPLLLNYFCVIDFDLGQYGDFLTGFSAFLAVVLTIIEFQFYKSRKVDERIVKALVVARKFIYSLQYLTSPFSTDFQPKENEPYPDRLIRERNERMDVVKEDFNEFITISRDADLYLSNEELKILDDIHEIWNRTKVGFKMHVMYLSNGMAASRQNEIAYQDAFIQGELNTKLQDALNKLNIFIKQLNERYKRD